MVFVMYRLLLLILVVVMLSSSTSIPFYDVRDSKRDARESLKPTKPYRYYIPSPFNDYSKVPKSDQK